MNIKKLVVAGTVTAMASLMLVGCGKKENVKKDGNKDDAFTLTVWTHPFVGKEQADKQKEVFDNMATEYKKSYPKAEVKFEEIPWANREQKIMTALSSGEGPDVMYMIPDMMAQFADKGIIEPLDEHLDKDFDKSDFYETSLKAVSYNDKLYGLPILREVQTMIYNTDVLKEIGGDENNLPTTWTEFELLAKKAKEKGYYARNFEGGNTLNATLYPFIWQAGGDIIKNGKTVIDSKESIKAYKEVKKYYDNGYIPKDSINTTDQNTLFIEGKMLAAYATGYLITALEEQGMNNFVIGSPLKEKELATFGTTGMFSVAQPSKHKTEAAKFIEIMTNEENMKAFCKLTNYIPARESGQTIFSDNENMKELTKYVDVANPGVIDPAARIFMPNVQSKLQAMLEGSLSPEEAAKDSADLIQQEMK